MLQSSFRIPSRALLISAYIIGFTLLSTSTFGFRTDYSGLKSIGTHTLKMLAEETKRSSNHRSGLDGDATNITPPEKRKHPTQDSAAAAVDFCHLVGGLKTTPRTGWVRRQVPKYESVADHSWRVALLSFLLPPQEFELAKCLGMGIIHDLAESVVGDICPADNMSKEDKQRMESEAMQKIAAALARANTNNAPRADSAVKRLMDLFHEYEKRESREAIAVKDLDLLDMILQADEYERKFGIDLGEFFDGTPVSRFQTACLKPIANEVHERRTMRLKETSNEKMNGSSTLSKRDAAFVEEHAKASTLSSLDIENVVRALRSFENSGG
jgi:putative hydrolase of HD superfamily